MSDFSIFVSTNSTGPLGSPYTGDGTGYYDGTTNGGTSCGSATPATPKIGGTLAVVNACGWQGFNTGIFVVAAVGNLPQSYFTSVTIGAPANLTFTSVSATYDNTSFPGHTVWSWADTHEFTWFGQNLGITFAATVSPAISPSTASVQVNGGTQLFTPSNFPSGVANWSAIRGTLDAAGNYYAPFVSSMPNPFLDTVTAKDSVDPTKTATAVVTLTPITVNVQGKFPTGNAFPPVQFANVGDIIPKIYMPLENITTRSQA